MGSVRERHGGGAESEWLRASRDGAQDGAAEREVVRHAGLHRIRGAVAVHSCALQPRGRVL